MTAPDVAPRCVRAGSPRFPRVRAAAAQLLLAVAVASGPATASAQVFLATHANPDFEIGPLFVRGSVDPLSTP